MLLNSRNRKPQGGGSNVQRANHGVQLATLNTMELNKDKNENFYLTLVLDTDSGQYSHRIFRPIKFTTLPSYGVESDETVDSIFWEKCDKLADMIARFVLLFDTKEEVNGEFISSFLVRYDEFRTALNKSLTVKVTDKNLTDFGFVKATKKVTKDKRDGGTYESYDRLIVRDDNDNPKYAYTDFVGETVPDYESVEFWNEFFNFVFNYLLSLKQANKLDIQFVVKLIRVKNNEFEKDADGKFIMMDGKRVVKSTFYAVSAPETIWFKHINDKMNLKVNVNEQRIIDEYMSQVQSLTANDEVEVMPSGASDDLPF
jgi:hypothetical protein